MSARQDRPSSELYYLKKRILALQNHIGIQQSEIQYAQESLGNNVRNNQLYLNRLQQLINMRAREQNLVEQRNEAINYITQCLEINSGSRKSLIVSLITVKASTAELINILDSIRKVLGYPANFALEVDSTQQSFYQSLLAENWLSMRDITKLFLVLRYFQEEISFNQIYNRLQQQISPNVPDLTMQFLFNDAIAIFSQFWQMCATKYQRSTNQAAVIQRMTYQQLLKMIAKEGDDTARYNEALLIAKQYGQRLCVVPTRVMKQGQDSFIMQSNISRVGENVLQNRSVKSLSNSLGSSETLQRSQYMHSNRQISDINYLQQQIENFQFNEDLEQTIDDLQHKLGLGQVEMDYARFCMDGRRASRQSYCKKLQAVYEDVCQVRKLQCRREETVRELQQFVATGRGSRVQLLTQIQQLKQNTIDTFFHMNHFQQTIGYPVSCEYRVEDVYRRLVADFSDDIIVLVLKVLRYPLQRVSAEGLVASMQETQNDDYRLLTLLNMDLAGELKNFPSTMWYLIDRAYQQCRQQPMSFDYKIGPEQMVSCYRSERENIEKLISLNTQCLASSIWICRVPVVVDGKVDCFRWQGDQKFPGLQLQSCVNASVGSPESFTTVGARAVDGGRPESIVQGVAASTGEHSADNQGEGPLSPQDVVNSTLYSGQAQDGEGVSQQDGAQQNTVETKLSAYTKVLQVSQLSGAVRVNQNEDSGAKFSVCMPSQESSLQLIGLLRITVRDDTDKFSSPAVPRGSFKVSQCVRCTSAGRFAVPERPGSMLPAYQLLTSVMNNESQPVCELSSGGTLPVEGELFGRQTCDYNALDTAKFIVPGFANVETLPVHELRKKRTRKLRQAQKFTVPQPPVVKQTLAAYAIVADTAAIKEPQAVQEFQKVPTVREEYAEGKFSVFAKQLELIMVEYFQKQHVTEQRDGVEKFCVPERRDGAAPGNSQITQRTFTKRQAFQKQSDEGKFEVPGGAPPGIKSQYFTKQPVWRGPVDDKFRTPAPQKDNYALLLAIKRPESNT